MTFNIAKIRSKKCGTVRNGRFTIKKIIKPN